MIANAEYLAQHLAELIAAAQQGEEVLISLEGQPRAKIVPLESVQKPSPTEAIFGLWAAREINPTEEVQLIRQGRGGDFSPLAF